MGNQFYCTMQVKEEQKQCLGFFQRNFTGTNRQLIRKSMFERNIGDIMTHRKIKTNRK